MSTEVEVVRYDRNEWPDKAEFTADGFLRVDAPITKLGVLKYRSDDGSQHGELRHPDDWTTQVALDALRSLPITNDHPPARESDGLRVVDATNAKKLAIGWNETVRVDGRELRSPIVIMDVDGIEAVKRGRRGTSTGIHVAMREESGVFEGEPYSFRQIPRRGNHIAIVDSPRAGTRIRLDGNEELEGDRHMSDRKLPTVKLDGIDYDAAQEVINALTKAQNEASDLKVRLDATNAQTSTLATERDALKAKLDAAESRDLSKEIADGVKARVALHDQARGVLPTEEHEKLDGMTDDEIRRAVIAAALPSFKLDGRSASDVITAFEIALGSKAEERNDDSRRADAIAAQRAKVTPKLDGSSPNDDVVKRELYRINNQARPDFDPNGYRA